MATGQQVREALKTTPGWEHIGRKLGFDVWRFKTIHTTPGYAVEAGYWSESEYSQLTFINIDDRQVLRGHFASPWTGRTDTQISFKKALEVIAQAADFHTRYASGERL
jgi:hypothetical protein